LFVVLLVYLQTFALLKIAFRRKQIQESHTAAAVLPKK